MIAQSLHTIEIYNKHITIVRKESCTPLQRTLRKILYVKIEANELKAKAYFLVKAFTLTKIKAKTEPNRMQCS